jgi:hypothetical protein
MRLNNVSYATLNFSPHAFSVAQLKATQIGSFETRIFSLTDLIEETRFVQDYLRKKYQIKNLITVSLSYSGLARFQLDLQYHNHWAKKIDEFIKDYQLPSSKRGQMIEGQVSLSRAAEGQA